MMPIRKITFQTDFYWKGDRYRQFIRMRSLPNLPKPKTVTCYKLYEHDGYIEMPLGRKVKPVIRIENG